MLFNEPRRQKLGWRAVARAGEPEVALHSDKDLCIDAGQIGIDRVCQAPQLELIHESHEKQE